MKGLRFGNAADDGHQLLVVTALIKAVHKVRGEHTHGVAEEQKQHANVKQVAGPSASCPGARAAKSRFSRCTMVAVKANHGWSVTRPDRCRGTGRTKSNQASIAQQLPGSD